MGSQNQVFLNLKRNSHLVKSLKRISGKKKSEFLLKDLGYDHFTSDPKIHGMVVESIQKLGTVAYDLPEVIFGLYPKIDWRGLVAMGCALGEAQDLCKLEGIVLWSVVEETLYQSF